MTSTYLQCQSLQHNQFESNLNVECNFFQVLPEKSHNFSNIFSRSFPSKSLVCRLIQLESTIFTQRLNFVIIYQEKWALFIHTHLCLWYCIWMALRTNSLPVCMRFIAFNATIYIHANHECNENTISPNSNQSIKLAEFSMMLLLSISFTLVRSQKCIRRKMETSTTVVAFSEETKKPW